ncbi:patched family protein [Ancylostoma ceylanicum]|uniref:Patched family protein n=1 Tax=Ancylostoma ceylanicum TaxID=53326 RepID=A0A0D6LBQ6_9BILA|nr:patched family protein [Ancylostoma ceylanicum]
MWYYSRKIIHDLWPLGEDNYVPGRAVTQSREAQVTVVAKNGGNILLPEYARSIKRLDMYIQNRIKVDGFLSICAYYPNVGLKISMKKKTQTMANQWNDNGTTQLDGILLQKVDSFVYLGREINMMNDLTTEIGRRRKAAWAAMDTIREITSQIKDTNRRAHIFDSMVRFRNHTYTYRELCLRWKNRGCPGNNHIQIISELYNHGINITYPTFRIGSRSGYLGAGIGGVSLSKDDNGTVILASARAWLMVYQLKFFPINVSYVSGIWEKTFKLHMDNYPEDPFISLTYFHSQTLAEELKRNADSLAPRFIFAFVILVIFAVICSMVTIKGTFYFDWVLSKPILSVFGVINAGMGIASAMGGLILLDVQYNDIVAVMPFLVVAVGTDNMFLMVAAVKRTCRAATVEQRIGECMADAARRMVDACFQATITSHFVR